MSQRTQRRISMSVGGRGILPSSIGHCSLRVRCPKAGENIQGVFVCKHAGRESCRAAAGEIKQGSKGRLHVQMSLSSSSSSSFATLSFSAHLNNSFLDLFSSPKVPLKSSPMIMSRPMACSNGQPTVVFPFPHRRRVVTTLVVSSCPRQRRCHRHCRVVLGRSGDANGCD